MEMPADTTNYINILRPRQNGRHFPDDIFKCIFLNENVWISLKISLKFVPKGPINNIPASVQIMAWHRPGDKPLSEAMLVSLLMHKCVTWPQWVKVQHHKLKWISMGKWTKNVDTVTHFRAKTKWPTFHRQYFQMHWLFLKSSEHQQAWY